MAARGGTQTKPEPIPASDAAPNPRFAPPADAATIDRTAAALREKGYEVHVADDLDAAKRIILGLLPEGAEVGEGASTTLDEIGVTAEVEASGRFDAIRPRTRALDYNTAEGRRQGRKLSSAPDYWLNSAHAVTEDGRIVIASNTGSQLGPLAFGAGQVIFAIGAQKIVPDLETALQRIEEYSFRLENARMQKLRGIPSAVNKILIINREFRAGRFTVVLIREAVGF
jgi:LUD domain